MSAPTRQHLRVLVFAVLVAAAIAAATTASGVASPALTAGSTTYTDPAGDSGGGPDITTVTVAGDAATSMIGVTVNAPGYLPTNSDGLEREVQVWLDTDRNRFTGDPQDGTEYVFDAWNDPTGRWYSFGRWNGSEWVTMPVSQSPTLSFARVGDVLTWKASSNDLGGTTGFRFYVAAGIWNSAADEWTTEDFAPDLGTWEYSLTSPAPTPPAPAPAAPVKVRLKIDAPKTTPGQAVAGKPFTVSFPVVFEKMTQVTSIDITTGETKTLWMTTWIPVRGGTMVCDPSVASKVIRHAESFKNGQARLSFVIPKTAKGKALKVKVKLTATEKVSGKTVTATKVATYQVR